jgi:hypothetical protein
LNGKEEEKEETLKRENDVLYFNHSLLPFSFSTEFFFLLFFSLLFFFGWSVEKEFKCGRRREIFLVFLFFF